MSIMAYLKKIIQPENLPSWVSLIAIIAVFFTLNNELSRSDIEEEKLKIVTNFTKSTLPIKFDDLKSDPKKLQAMSELVSAKLAIQTARGFEATRFDPRLKDDIYVSVRLALSKHQSEKERFVYPNTCDEIKSVIFDAEVMIIKLEELRGGRINDEFKLYLQDHRDVILKQMFANTDRNVHDYALSLECFGKSKA
jgi:hypothetical protein